MTNLDLAGHLAYICILWGMIYISQRKQVGWSLRFFGEGIWVGIGAIMEMTSIWVWGLVFMVIDAWGYWKWSKE